MVLHDTRQGRFVFDVGDPAWELRVPDQCMSADHLGVICSPGYEIIGAIEVEFALRSYSFRVSISPSPLLPCFSIGNNVPSVVAHFILFSGVTHPKFACMIAALLLAVSLFLSVATPKYFFPFALISASMLHAAAVPVWRARVQLSRQRRRRERWLEGPKVLSNA